MSRAKIAPGVQEMIDHGVGSVDDPGWAHPLLRQWHEVQIVLRAVQRARRHAYHEPEAMHREIDRAFNALDRLERLAAPSSRRKEQR